jgi:hypothetical protein
LRNSKNRCVQNQERSGEKSCLDDCAVH